MFIALGYYLGVKLLDHVITLFNFFEELKLFSKESCITLKGASVFMSWSALYLLFRLQLCWCVGEWYLIVVFVFLTTNDVE